jgi:glycosyltransferase involved in cell wall biosynthesis
VKILHLHLSREFAGSETYAASLASLQVAAGHQVRVLVRQSFHVPRWQGVVKGAHGGARANELGILVLPRWAVGPLAKWVAKRYAVGFGAEVLHSHLGRAHKLAAWLGQGLKIPHVGTMHLRFKPKEHTACDALVAVAQWQAQEVPATYPGPVKVVWNWLAKRPEKSQPKPPSQTFTFGSVGRLHPQKGMTTLVQAFQQAFPDNPQVCLEIVGEGPERTNLECLIGADRRITLQGYQPDTAPFYARWQAYVSAAKYEPFGLTVLEAMAHALPLVCTRTEGPTEFLAPQVPQPFWADKEDVASLAQALQQCYAARQLSVVWDMSPFDGTRAQAQIEDLYKELLA